MKSVTIKPILETEDTTVVVTRSDDGKQIIIDCDLSPIVCSVEQTKSIIWALEKLVNEPVA